MCARNTYDRNVPVFPILIVQWALFESVTLFGFVPAKQAAEPRRMLPFLGAALLGIVPAFPSRMRVERLDGRAS